MPTSRTWRHFFRYRLSTWFVLVGIVAWAMAQRPFIGMNSGEMKGPPIILGELDLKRGSWSFEYQSDRPGGRRLFEFGFALVIGPNPGLLYPILALAAFLAWKGFWLWRARRREPSATQI